MSVKYKLKQIVRPNTKFDGKWYAEAVPVSVITLDELATRIQRNATVKRSDILAVLSELGEAITDELLAGNRVKIDGLGSFRVALKTTTADTAADWSQIKNLKGATVSFKPETYDQTVNGTRVRSPKALRDMTLEELKQYTVESEEAASLASDDIQDISEDGTVTA